MNERLKLIATSVNTIGLTIPGAAVLVPLVGGVVSASAAIWILVAVVLHLLAQLFLERLRSEDWAMDLPMWFQWGVPAGALTLGLVAWLWVEHEVAKFDRRYGKRGSARHDIIR